MAPGWYINPLVPKQLFMYVCFEYWRAEIKFKWFFFQVFVEIFLADRGFEIYFSTRNEFETFSAFFDKCWICQKFIKCWKICWKSQDRQKKSRQTREKKARLNFISARQYSKQTYIGNLVYQGVALNTLDTNELSRSTLGTSGLSVQKC